MGEGGGRCCGGGVFLRFETIGSVTTVSPFLGMVMTLDWESSTQTKRKLCKATTNEESEYL